DGTYASTVDRGVPGVSGLGDGAAHFAGTGDPIPNAVVPYTPTLNPTTPFSIEFWAKPDRDGRQDIAVLSSQDRNSGRAGYAIYQGLNGAVWEAHIGFQNSVLFVSGMTRPEAGRWDHVVVTWDGIDTTRIYVN